MKSKYSILIMLFVAFFSFADGKTSSIKDTVSEAVSGFVSMGKDTLAGVDQGIAKGREDGESVDGARIISSPETLAKYDIKLSISKVNKLSKTTYELVMVIRNNEAEPVRFINLFRPLKVILLDKDAFASSISNQYFDITVPAKAAIKSSWKFYDVEGAPDILRIYDLEYKVPDAE